jgi:chemotaxis protein methyltransferase CheR
MRYLRDLVHRKSAIVVEADKDYLLESRLGPLAKQNALASIDELVRQVRLDERSPLTHAVIEAMTTNETSFFRDIHPFEALKTKLLPDLIAARAQQRALRIWCAAASTGQEPYSIAIAMREAFPELASWNVEILATDLNATVLARARSGLYKQLEVNRGLPAMLLVKYFDRVGMDWQIKPEIRSMVTFRELNLLDRWPLFAAQDMVFIRNVLIYFDLPTKRQLLGRVRDALRPDGYLVLGGAETTLNLHDGYNPVRIGPSIYYQPRPIPTNVTPGSVMEGKVANASR